jgi:hypothetical protein
MSQEAADFVVDNGTGAAVRADLNKILDSILTNNSGSSVPSYAKAYTLWADTGNNVMKIRNAANDGFIELFQLDGTITLEDGSASTPALAFRNDLNTGIYQSGADKLNIATGGVERMELGSSTIFNEGGASIDFRIESDTQTHAFFLDASESFISIGTASPNAPLHVKTSVSDQRAILKLETFQPKIRFQDNTASAHSGEIKQDGDALRFNISVPVDDTTDLGEKMRLTSDGELGLGTTSPNTKLDVRDPSGTGISSRSTATQATDTNKGLKVRNNSDTDTFSVSYKGQGYFAGNVGIGNTTPNSKLQVGANDFDGTGASGTAMAKIASTSSEAFVLGLVERGGQGLGISCRIDGAGSSTTAINFMDGPALTSVGTVTCTSTATAYNQSGSDRTLKKNFENWTDTVLTSFKNLNPQKFNFIHEDDTAAKHKGYIAQDLVADFPEAYPKSPDTEKYMYNPSGMVVYLMKAIQELEAKVAALETA